MSVTNTMRYHVLDRDGHTCQYCGAKAPDTELQVDHIIPVSAGGEDRLDNLIAACKDCNSGKGTSLGRAKPKTSDELQEQLDELRKRRDLLRQIAEEGLAILRVESDTKWHLVEFYCRYRGIDEDRAPINVVNCIGAAIRRAGFQETKDCLEIALSKLPNSDHTDTMRYFHGVMRKRKNDAHQEMLKSVLMEDSHE